LHGGSFGAKWGMGGENQAYQADFLLPNPQPVPGRHRPGDGHKRLSALFLDRLLPPSCFLTGIPVDKAHRLSGPAWASLHFIDAPNCPGCAVPYAVDPGPGHFCANCLADDRPLSRTRAAIVYDDASHRLITALKFGDRLDLAPMLADWMIRCAGPLFDAEPLLVPVPLHRKRLAARRYNQAQVLSDAIARKTGLTAPPDLLRRHRATTPQTDLSMEARLRNVTGAFRLAPKAGAQVEGRSVVLVDDVFTTGATLGACARPLLRAGALRVDALVLARVVKTEAGAI